MDTLSVFATIDTARLWATIARLISIETVQNAQEFAVKINEAKDILIEAGLRIAGYGSRDLLDPQQAVKVATVVAAYYED